MSPCKCGGSEEGGGGGEVERQECCVQAVGWAESTSKAHTRPSVMYKHNGVAPSAITQSCQAWARSLKIMPPVI